jgi:prepilin-type N-terminal cleavage/methylation domain-containing protein
MAKAYSLVELLVVLAIMAVLIGIAVGSAVAFLDRAGDRAMQTEKATVLQAIKVYNTLAATQEDAKIEAQLGPDAMRIDPKSEDAPPFASYLDAHTKFFYLWDKDGEDLRVYDRADRSGKVF